MYLFSPWLAAHFAAWLSQEPSLPAILFTTREFFVKKSGCSITSSYSGGVPQM